jgi:hypothetical protein
MITAGLRYATQMPDKPGRQLVRATTIILALLLTPAWSLIAAAHDGSIRVITGHDGAAVATSLPRHCLVNGVMRCHRYDPLLHDGSMKNSLEPRDRTTLDDPGQVKQLPAGWHGDQIIKLDRNGLCLQAGDPGYDRSSGFELFFSVEKCRARSAELSGRPL